MGKNVEVTGSGIRGNAAWITNVTCTYSSTVQYSTAVEVGWDASKLG